MYRLFVEKLERFDVESGKLMSEIKSILGIIPKRVRILNVYNVKNISREVFELSVRNVFSEPNVDKISESLKLPEGSLSFRVEYLKGQYDQRADSAAQCISLLSSDTNAKVISSRLYVIEGVDTLELDKIKSLVINPVESHEVPMDEVDFQEEAELGLMKVETLEDFTEMDEESLVKLYASLGLAMSFEDFLFTWEHFKQIERNPTITEIRVLDTYWSDHCRHTTFNTNITEVDLSECNIQSLRQSYEDYLSDREELGRKGMLSLMDLAVINARTMKKRGFLSDLEISDEINAASIEAKVDVDGKPQDYLIMFKNETHNHPTEIEPFGGAATCLGGAIRDPLSGRAYVYQSMRITGSADPRKSLNETIPGKLTQKAITTGAAHGFSSYGNQIGLQTGLVREYYEEGFAAKRMEVGFVIGAAPKQNVKRLTPENGDIILLIGGSTGRDGIGGATGSSKSHDTNSVEKSGAEVQKGNAPTERKLQRLYANPAAASMIKRSNDFGAGGVSVAIGEIAHSLEVDLDKLPVKYLGLDGTELAISESQERMAVCISPEDKNAFEALCEMENIQTSHVGTVTDTGRFTIKWKGSVILDLDRDFVDSAGAKSFQDVKIERVDLQKYPSFRNVSIEDTISSLNVCSQRGLVEMFDNSIGANNILNAFGGDNLATPSEGMAARIPVRGGVSSTVSVCTSGYNPQIAKFSPFHGGMYAVVESLTKQLSLGADIAKVRLTFQEYFEKLGKDPVRWGKPFAALLGAKKVMDRFSLAAIGGKDSMSGTYTHGSSRIDVPPTLISFAVSLTDEERILYSSFRKEGSNIYILKAPRNEDMTFDLDGLSEMYEYMQKISKKGYVLASYPVEYGSVEAALYKMAIGNGIGFEASIDMKDDCYGSIIVETSMNLDGKCAQLIGTTAKGIIINGKSYDLGLLEKAYEQPLESVFPTKAKAADWSDIEKASKINYSSKQIYVCSNRVAKPEVFLPVFPGTNCELDTASRFAQAGASTSEIVFRNLTPNAIEESIEAIAAKIKSTQILALSGGFSAGDEPDGSGKFITAVFRNEKIRLAVEDLLERDGLILGICNGFQALVKLGLLPYGKIKDLEDSDPTLTYNTIGRHAASFVNTKVVSDKSPWLKYASKDKIYKTPVSHGEGRFFADEKTLRMLSDNGQIAIQYVDDSLNPSMQSKFNPNGSSWAIEAITSPDGRILGKMGHVERVRPGLYRNLNGIEDMKLFESGIDYFK